MDARSVLLSLLFLLLWQVGCRHHPSDTRSDSSTTRDPRSWPPRWFSCKVDPDCSYVSTGQCLPCDEWGAAVVGVNGTHQPSAQALTAQPLPQACRSSVAPCQVSSLCKDGRCEAEIVRASRTPAAR